MPHLSAKCGEETSPTPQTDWSLAHGFKTAFGLNSYGINDSTFRFLNHPVRKTSRQFFAHQRILCKASTMPIQRPATQPVLLFFGGRFPENGRKNNINY